MRPGPHDTQETEHVTRDRRHGDAVGAVSGERVRTRAELETADGRMDAAVNGLNGELDAAVFCLSLMGTNFMDFIREAHRTLKPKYARTRVARNSEAQYKTKI